MTLEVSPAFSFARANHVVRASIQADPDNRSVEIIAESWDLYRSCEIALNGDRAPRVNIVEFRSLPPGAYEITATLIGPGGRERAMVRLEVNVMSTGGSY
jgi:hypothetical protein